MASCVSTLTIDDKGARAGRMSPETSTICPAQLTQALTRMHIHTLGLLRSTTCYAWLNSVYAYDSKLMLKLLLVLNRTVDESFHTHF